MRRTVGWLALTVAVVCGISVSASEKPSEDFQNAMKAMSTAMGPTGLRAHVPAKDYGAIAKDAATLKANYAKIEKFFTQKKWADAVESSKAGAKGAADLEAAVKAKDEAGMTAAMSAINKTCGGCHATHRERLPDATFAIK